MLSEWYQYRTHAHITGMGQTGKSTTAKGMMRQHILNDEPVWLFDRHGTLYDDMVKFCALVRPRMPVILVNPSSPDFVVPFNPFRLRGEITAHAMRQAVAIVKPWGEQNTDETPTYERLAQMLLHFMGASNEPLHHAVKLLELPKKELREYAISIIEDDFIRQQWTQLQYLAATRSGFREWKYEVLSTQNRLMRFVASKSVRLFTGLPGPGLDVSDAYEQGAHVFMNLRPSSFLSPVAANLFAALAFSELLNTALNHMGQEMPAFIYADECQTYMTPDVADMLDQVLKTGMRLTLIHHHLGQFRDHHLIESIKTNAQIKLVFAGLPVDTAKETAEEFFIHELNRRWKREDKVHYVTEHELEEYEIRGEGASETEAKGRSQVRGTSASRSNTNYASQSTTETESWSDGGSCMSGESSMSTHGLVGEEESSSSSSGMSEMSGYSWGFGSATSEGRSRGNAKSAASASSRAEGESESVQKGRSQSVQRGTRYKPMVRRIVDGQDDFPRDEKVSVLAERLMSVPQRTCWVKLPDRVFKWNVPWVEPVLLDNDIVVQFIQESPNAIPLHEAEEILRREERRFLERSKEYDTRGGRPKKKPPHLAQQS